MSALTGRRAPARLGAIGKKLWPVHLSTVLAAIGGLSIAAFIASAVFDVVQARESAINGRLHELTNLSRALSEQTLRSVQTVQVLVGETAQDPLVADPHRPRDNRELYRRLRRSTATMPQVLELQILDTDGAVAYRTGEFPADHEVSSLAQFALALQANRSDHVRLSSARRQESNDQWTVPISQHIRGPNGSTLGAVVALLDLRYFERFYQALGLAAGSSVSLYQSDGRLLARYPSSAEAIGRVVPPVPMGDGVNLPAHGTALILRAPDRKPTLFAAQHVAGTPLVVALELDQAVALAPWQRTSEHIALRTLLLTSTVALLIGLVIRQLKQRERIDERLRESEQRYALAMAGSSEGHWDWDLRSRRVYLSPRMLALTGLGSEESLMRDDWIDRLDLVHADDRAQRKAALLRHLRGRTRYYECEYRIRARSGEYRWVLDRGVALRDAHGRVYRMAGAIADITPRKQAEAERARLEQRLRQAEKLEALGALAGGIAHDFNSMLGAILGYAEMAMDATPPDSPLARYTRKIKLAADRAGKLVDQILAYSRSSRGRRDAVDLRAVIEETLDLIRASLPPTIALNAALTAVPAVVIGDATNLHQVVMNLCTNAIHAMPEGGTLTVALDAITASAEQHLTQGSLTPGRYMRLSIADTGSGIPPQLLSKIFEPFFTTKAPGVGTGLGLALVQGIVADLDGAIRVSSEAHVGSTFEVYLPGEHGSADDADRLPPPRYRTSSVAEPTTATQPK